MSSAWSRIEKRTTVEKMVLGLAFVQGLVKGSTLARDSLRDGDEDEIVRVEGS